MLGGALLLYYLLDLLLILFLGIVVATALQPAHVRLSRWGVPKGLAVLLIYFFFLLIIAMFCLFVGPILFEEISTFVAGLPQQYAQFITNLQSSSNTFLQLIGARLPSFSVITQQLSTSMPAFVGNMLQFMTSAVSFFTAFVMVLATGFYWTMEVLRWERVVVSLAPTTRREQILDTWHEIEEKLGGFIRGQGLAMLTIGAAFTGGYWLIGLPNELVLWGLAGLLEAIPIVGPILGVVPAIFVAIPLGWNSVLLVVGFATLLQLFESNVLIPRIMSKTVGISSLVGLFAVLAFGTLYGVLGAFIAIPLTVVLQVLLERIFVNPEPLSEDTLIRIHPLEVSRVNLEALRQRLRERLRDRSTRLQTNGSPRTADQVVDQVEQKLESAVERVEAIITTLQQDTPTLTTSRQPSIVSEVERATHALEQSIAQVESLFPVLKSEEKLHEQTPPSITLEAELQQVIQHVEASVASLEQILSEIQPKPEASPLLSQNQARGLQAGARMRKD
jgi:predicted PurR-regulated permease PerM